MKQILKEIRYSTHAKNWIKENETGRKCFQAMRKKEQEQLIEQVGAKSRSMTPFNPVTIKESPKEKPLCKPEQWQLVFSVETFLSLTGGYKAQIG